MTKFEEAVVAGCKAFLSYYQQETAPKEKAQPKVTQKFSNEIPVCPRHDKAMKEGKYGYFCSTKEDDPEYSNKNGYCNYKPR